VPEGCLKGEDCGGCIFYSVRSTCRKAIRPSPPQLRDAFRKPWLGTSLKALAKIEAFLMAAGLLRDPEGLAQVS